jgi:hypothetical protein
VSTLRKLYTTTPQHWLHRVKQSLKTASGQSHRPQLGPSQGVPRPAILDDRYFDDAARVIQRLVARVIGGESAIGVLQGFDGRRYTERVAEYPVFVEWLLETPDDCTLLDVGSVLNNAEVSEIIRSRCRSLWFCNPNIEGEIHFDGPLYYHRSALAAAFPGGETFDLVTCLSTIEHIGFDNSQYGSEEKARYSEPTIEPLQEAFTQLARLMKPGGRLLVSVPFGLSEAITHPVTNRIAMQVFDDASLKSGMSELSKSSISTRVRVFAAEDSGWYEINPEACTRRYAEGVPAAAAVAFVYGEKSR